MLGMDLREVAVTVLRLCEMHASRVSTKIVSCAPCEEDVWMIRSIEVDITIVPGNAGLIHARSGQMRSLMVMGRSEDELWEDMEPVLRDLFDIQGDKVVTMVMDRTERRVHVDVE
jgi:hypothetical protein